MEIQKAFRNIAVFNVETVEKSVGELKSLISEEGLKGIDPITFKPKMKRIQMQINICLDNIKEIV